mgnify:FL=1
MTRSKERIRLTGEVFTPSELVEFMLDQLPDEQWRNPERTFLDKSCGDGNFLVAVVRRKLLHGSTPLQALSTTYGVELMPDNVAECKRRLLEIVGDCQQHREVVDHNIVCHDALTFDYWAPTLW